MWELFLPHPVVTLCPYNEYVLGVRLRGKKERKRKKKESQANE